MKTLKLAEQYDLLGVSERTLEKLQGPLNAPPDQPVRIISELLCKAARKLPRNKREGHLQTFWDYIHDTESLNTAPKASDFALLPPARLRISRHLALPQIVCPDAWRKLESMSGLPAEVITAEVLLGEDFSDFRRYLRSSMEGYKQSKGAEGTSETNLGYLELMLSMMHWEVGGGQTYVTSDELDAELRASELPRDLPAACLMTPYPAAFIAFTESGSSPLTLHDTTTGSHRLQGVFVYQSYTSASHIPAKGEESISKALHKVPGAPVRSLQLVFMGEGKSTPWDDTYNCIQLSIVDENEPLVDMLERHMQVYSQDRVLPEGTPLERISEADKGALRVGIEHLAKTLLYMGSLEAQFEPHDERTRLLRQLKGKKNAAKLAKLMARADRFLDYTVLGRGDQCQAPELLKRQQVAKGASERRKEAAAQPSSQLAGMFELPEEGDDLAWLNVAAVQPSESDPTRPVPVTLRQRRTRWISSKKINLRPDLSR